MINRPAYLLVPVADASIRTKKGKVLLNYGYLFLSRTTHISYHVSKGSIIHISLYDVPQTLHEYSVVIIIVLHLIF
jgi:hypothetical protein